MATTTMLVDNTSDMTLAGKQVKVYEQLKTIFSTNFNSNRDIYNGTYKLFWNNPDALTPQQVSDGLGIYAAEYIANMSAMKTYLNTLKPSTITSVMPAHQVNANGTVTIL